MRAASILPAKMAASATKGAQKAALRDKAATHAADLAMGLTSTMKKRMARSRRGRAATQSCDARIYSARKPTIALAMMRCTAPDVRPTDRR